MEIFNLEEAVMGFFINSLLILQSEKNQLIVYQYKELLKVGYILELLMKNL